MICSLTYAVMTLANRYFSERYVGRVICLYEQGTAAVVLLPSLLWVQAQWRPTDILGVAFTGIICTAFRLFPVCYGAKRSEGTDRRNYLGDGDGIWNPICAHFPGRSACYQGNCRRSRDTWRCPLLIHLDKRNIEFFHLHTTPGCEDVESNRIRPFQ